MARAARRIANQGRVSLHHPYHQRHYRIQWFVVDGIGMRRKPGDDGRGRSNQAPGFGYRDGLDP